jgi:alkylhydroperoxidase/carboxymuconolactone decarboxylase family protein YurZ
MEPGPPVKGALPVPRTAGPPGAGQPVHVAANLNVGNDRRTLLGVLTVLVPFIGYPRTLNALAAVNEVVPATKEGR